MKVKVKISPNSKKAEVIEEDSFLKVKVDTTPHKGKANKRLIEILSEYFLVSKSQLRILKGEFSKDKLIEILE